MRTLAASLVAACFVASACTATGKAVPASCTIDADCGAARICGFAVKDACSAVGECFPQPGAVCLAYSAGCACDGTTINVACTGLPSGYALKTLAHAGGCVDAATEAGGPCMKDADCGTTEICGFAQKDGCSAHGKCFPAPGAVCLAYSAGCACDGTLINIACTGLPSDYFSKPLAHPGACGASEAGACCPTGWDLYSCTYPDGGPGHACHNPVLGCASSSTCGEGCDFAVEGRCDGG